MSKRKVSASALLARIGLLAVLAANACAQIQWRQPEGRIRLTGRTGAAMAYDAARTRAVLFGGYSNTNLVAADPHWEWDGAQWTQGPAGPEPRAHSAMAFDGAQWTTPSPGLSTPARMSDAIAFDEARSQMVWFGATSALNPSTPGTFVFTGTAWQRMALAQEPQSRTNHAMAYDRARSRVVLFGGTASNGTSLRDTWEWDGASWTQSRPPTPRHRSTDMR